MITIVSMCRNETLIICSLFQVTSEEGQKSHHLESVVTKHGYKDTDRVQTKASTLQMSL